MQNNINNNEPDIFSERVRQKLENHQVPVDISSWDKIEEHLKSKRKRIIPFWSWLSGGAAVAALVLLFILHPLNEQNGSSFQSKSTKILHKTTLNKQFVKHQTPQLFRAKIKKTNQMNTVNLIYDKKAGTIVELRTPTEKKVHKEKNDSKSSNGIVPNNNPENEKIIVQNKTENKDTVSKNKPYIPNDLIEDQGNGSITTLKNNWLLATSISANGNVPASNGNYGLTAGSNQNISSYTSLPTIGTTNNFTNIIYAPPVSIGLIVRKQVNKTFSLESGLMYTYLFTKFENNLLQRNDAELHLHYIGVPLNMVAQIWDNSKWEIYLSGGGMIEKGIRSFYVSNGYINNQTISTTAMSNIEGIQWSVNGSVGTTYKIQRNFGIFFEPKISYFFDNNQPISARTAYPVVIGLNAGIRFQFK